MDQHYLTDSIEYDNCDPVSDHSAERDLCAAVLLQAVLDYHRWRCQIPHLERRVSDGISGERQPARRLLNKRRAQLEAVEEFLFDDSDSDNPLSFWHLCRALGFSPEKWREAINSEEFIDIVAHQLEKLGELDIREPGDQQYYGNGDENMSELRCRNCFADAGEIEFLAGAHSHETFAICMVCGVELDLT